MWEKKKTGLYKDEQKTFPGELKDLNKNRKIFNLLKENKINFLCWTREEVFK